MTPPIVGAFLVLAAFAPIPIPMWIIAEIHDFAMNKGLIKPDPEELWRLERNRYRGAVCSSNREAGK